MKVLFIGGTGNISTSVSKMAIHAGIDLYLLNRGKRPVDLAGSKTIVCDYSKKEIAKEALANHQWDVVVNWIAFTKEDIQRDYELFAGKTKQYIFISSASAYQKPVSHYLITESTPLKNPYWQYSRDKIACEDELNMLYRERDFPITIVRPSLTYDTVIPVAIGSWDDYTIVDRMKKGKPIIVHGDGTSLWTITHAIDFGKGLLGLLGHQQAIGQAFHITSDEVLNWNQIYEAVAEAAGVQANIVHIPSDFIVACGAKIDWSALGGDFMAGNLLGDKAVSVVFDNSKIKRFVPGFQAVIPFKVGIKQTVAWFEAEPSRMRIVPENNRFMDVILEAWQGK